MAMPAVLGSSRAAVVIGAGLLLGLAYTLSPLSILALSALTWAAVAASRGLSDAEKRWFWSIMSISIVIRLIAIAALFYTADPARPFASFFGDEELYKFRTVWLRNIGQGMAMSPADVIYSFDEVGNTSYIYVLAFIQALVGDAPYGLHVMNMALYVCGILGLYRLARASYGGVVAMGGLLLLLSLPSLGLWSISVLKEPMSAFMIAVEVICAVMIVRAPRWWQRIAFGAIVILAGLAMESLRTGGALTAACGTLGGLGAAFVLARGRRLALAMIAAPVVVVLVASMPAVQERALSRVREAAWYHAGHVLTFGYSYRLVPAGYYGDRNRLHKMPPADAARFVVKAVSSYVVEPLPWKMESRMLLAFMPEQVAWYAIVLLLPIGVYAGLRRDIVVTCMLASHAAAAMLIIALASGNVGTLIRHRALALPYIVWLSAAGAHEVIRRVAAGRAAGAQRSADGDR
jgi:hypothetical protein